MIKLDIIQRLEKIDNTGFDFWATPTPLIRRGETFVYYSEGYEITSVGDRGAGGFSHNGDDIPTTRFSARKI